MQSTCGGHDQDCTASDIVAPLHELRQVVTAKDKHTVYDIRDLLIWGQCSSVNQHYYYLHHDLTLHIHTSDVLWAEINTDLTALQYLDAHVAGVNGRHLLSPLLETKVAIRGQPITVEYGQEIRWIDYLLS